MSLFLAFIHRSASGRVGFRGLGWLALWFGLLLSTACGRSIERPDRDAILASSYGRNILIVLFDAAAAHHFSAYGHERSTTPHFDALAAESVLFEQAYAQASGTAMSMYSMFTSRYPVLETVANASGEHAVVVAEQLVTLPEALQSRYLDRLMISINPFVTAQMGFAQGVTEMVEDWKEPEGVRRGLAPRYADRVTGPALDWIASRGKEPWFAYLHYIEPHAPYMPPEPYRGRFKKYDAPLATGDIRHLRQLEGTDVAPVKKEIIHNLYDGNLAFVDSELGKLIDSLKANGEWERTIIVVLSDHGEGFWEHGTKGHGGAPYEEVVRVPLLLRIPGLPGLDNLRIQTPVELVDLMPTLLDLSGFDSHELGLVGSSWLPLLAGEADDDPFPVDRVIHVRSNRMRRPVFGIRRGGFKWLFHSHDERQELFDLRNDPDEQNDLLKSGGGLPDAAADFPAILRVWLSESEDSLSGSHAVENEVLSPEMIESLKSLGYIE